jgi:hypothetical protein
MKTFKFALIAAIVACTMVRLANADGFHEKPISKKIMNISLEKAMKMPGLVAAMYQQIDKREILHSPNHIYVDRISHRRHPWPMVQILQMGRNFACEHQKGNQWQLVPANQREKEDIMESRCPLFLERPDCTHMIPVVELQVGILEWIGKVLEPCIRSIELGRTPITTAKIANHIFLQEQ